MYHPKLLIWLHCSLVDEKQNKTKQPPPKHLVYTVGMSKYHVANNVDLVSVYAQPTFTCQKQIGQAAGLQKCCLRECCVYICDYRFDLSP